MTITPVRIAFIGSGDHAQRAHVVHLAHIPDAKIVAVADPSETAYHETQQIYGRPIPLWVKDSADVITNPNVDAVLISSPDSFHLSQLCSAVDAGKHVFCEKPLCDDMAKLPYLQMAFNRANQQGLVVTSCHPRRFDPPYVWLKKNLAALTERFGAPVKLDLDFTYHKPSKTGLHDGSMLQDHMNHEFDYLAFLFGKDSVVAHKLIDEEDRYHVAGQRADGISFVFGGTRRLDSKTYAETIRLRFEHGEVFIDTYNPSNSYFHNHEHPRNHTEPNPAPGKTDYDVRFMSISKNWIDAILGKGTNYLTSEEMMANTYMSVAFKNNKTVEFSY